MSPREEFPLSRTHVRKVDFPPPLFEDENFFFRKQARVVGNLESILNSFFPPPFPSLRDFFFAVRFMGLMPFPLPP